MEINNKLKFHQTNESINQIPFSLFDGIAVQDRWNRRRYTFSPILSSNNKDWRYPSSFSSKM